MTGMNVTDRIDKEFEEAYQIQLNKNRVEVRKKLEANDKDLLAKIRNRVERFGYDEDVLKEQIKNNPIVADSFAIDPAKQSIHQNTAAEILKKFSMIYDFEVLPAGGKRSLFLTPDGQILPRDIVGKNKDSKSIDFKWHVKTKSGKELTCYASHKYTRWSNGGMQDEQFKDVQLFAKAATKINKDAPYYCFTITDGEYYKAKNNKRLNELHIYDCPHFHAVTLGTLEQILKQLSESM